MKFDRFLAVLFSRRTVVLLLLVIVMAFTLTSCSITFEDVLCLTVCGCFSFETCQKIIWSCDCDNCRWGFIDCGGWTGDAYNSCFSCVWEGGLKDCRPSRVCESCEGNDDEEDYEYNSPSCDQISIDLMDMCIDCLDG